MFDHRSLIVDHFPQAMSDPAMKFDYARTPGASLAWRRLITFCLKLLSAYGSLLVTLCLYSATGIRYTQARFTTTVIDSAATGTPLFDTMFVSIPVLVMVAMLPGFSVLCPLLLWRRRDIDQDRLLVLSTWMLTLIGFWWIIAFAAMHPLWQEASP